MAVPFVAHNPQKARLKPAASRFGHLLHVFGGSGRDLEGTSGPTTLHKPHKVLVYPLYTPISRHEAPMNLQGSYYSGSLP